MSVRQMITDYRSGRFADLVELGTLSPAGVWEGVLYSAAFTSAPLAVLLTLFGGVWACENYFFAKKKDGAEFSKITVKSGAAILLGIIVLVAIFFNGQDAVSYLDGKRQFQSLTTELEHPEATVTTLDGWSGTQRVCVERPSDRVVVGQALSQEIVEVRHHRSCLSVDRALALERLLDDGSRAHARLLGASE